MSRALALLCVFGCLYGVLADICNQTAPSDASAQDIPVGPGKVEVQFTANNCTENVTCTLCPHNQTAKPLDASFKENEESYCIFTNLAQNVHYTVKFACNGTAVQQKKLDYYFNSEPVRNSPNVSTWSRSANIMMEAFCFAMQVDIGYMMVNISDNNMDTRCVVFPTCHKCDASLCPQPPSSCGHQSKIDLEKCDEQPGYINITLPLDNLRPSTHYTFDLYYIYCDLNANIILNSTLRTTTGAGDPVDVTNINATPMGSRSVTVTWTLPSPDPANYTLHIRDADPGVGEAGTGCDVDTTWPIIIPWNVTTYKNTIQGPHDIEVPHPFWQYQVAVVMSTEAGNSTPQWVTVRTLPESPGAVSHLDVKTRQPVEGDITCGNAPWESYNDVCVKWEEVCLREQGDDITTYQYTLSNGDTPETRNVNCKPGDNEENHGMRQDRTRTTCSLLLPVDTGSNYILCMTAIGRTYKGLTNCTSFQVPRIKPNITDKEQHQAHEISTQRQKSSFALSLTSYCFMTSDTYGRVVINGFVISKKSWTNEGNLSTLPTWYNRSMGYYQIRPSFLKNRESCRNKQDLIVGNENCNNPPYNPYCNGPLDPGSTYSVTGFVCTKDGCDSVPVAKDITTEEEPGMSVTTLVLMLLGLLCIPLLGFLFYCFICCNRCDGLVCTRSDCCKVPREEVVRKPVDVGLSLLLQEWQSSVVKHILFQKSGYQEPKKGKIKMAKKIRTKNITPAEPRTWDQSSVKCASDMEPDADDINVAYTIMTATTNQI